ncbi:hypothetical protein AJ79_04921 [Helicocarpus griseus UAMH5409]|uniref:HNH nuclease domain-containing protein n=1 Tax=Helicocarpus griseus UAMH5409 TaxID=1447875 RepID=A0A2B7XR22_9EURO|nr:hypothetical protein AJ79_04921 [Helicocarpus griseus UAMH5409]
MLSRPGPREPVTPQLYCELMENHFVDLEALRWDSERISKTRLKMKSTKDAVSDYFQYRVACCMSDLEYLSCYGTGLRELFFDKILEDKEYNETMRSMQEDEATIRHELCLVDLFRHTLEQDVYARYEQLKIKRLRACIANEEEPRPRQDYKLIQTVFESVIKEKKLSLKSSVTDQKDKDSFCLDVLTHYDARGQVGGSYCVVNGWNITSGMDAAQLVPSLTQGDIELSHLFKEERVDMLDWKNGIPLHRGLAWGLRCGIIAIIPSGVEEVAWKMILINEKYRDCIFMGHRTWNVFDGKTLNFRSEKQPARRYLYFRFVMSYLQAVVIGNHDFVQKVESKTISWALPGEFVEEKILRLLAKHILGYDMPSHLYKGRTFRNGQSKGDIEQVGTALAGLLYSWFWKPKNSPIANAGKAQRDREALWAVLELPKDDFEPVG